MFYLTALIRKLNILRLLVNMTIYVCNNVYTTTDLIKKYKCLDKLHCFTLKTK